MISPVLVYSLIFSTSSLKAFSPYSEEKSDSDKGLFYLVLRSGVEVFSSFSTLVSRMVDVLAIESGSS